MRGMLQWMETAQVHIAVDQLVLCNASNELVAHNAGDKLVVYDH